MVDHNEKDVQLKPPIANNENLTIELKEFIQQTLS